MSEKQERYKAYFQALIDELRILGFTGPRGGPHEGRPQNYEEFHSGIQGIYYLAKFARGDKVLTYVRIDESVQVNRLDLYNALKQRRKEIESDFGSPLEWRPRDQSSVITVSRDGHIRLSDGTLECIRLWHIVNLLKLKKVFEPYIRQALETLNSSE